VLKVHGLYLIKNSQAVKKYADPKKAVVKKDVKSKVAGKNGRLMVKTKIQGNLICILHVSLGFSPKYT